MQLAIKCVTNEKNGSSFKAIFQNAELRIILYFIEKSLKNKSAFSVSSVRTNNDMDCGQKDPQAEQAKRLKPCSSIVVGDAGY